MNRTRETSFYLAAGLAALVIGVIAVPLHGEPGGTGNGGGNGNIDGAIYTTTVDGAVVNENTHYSAKSEVYLNGGPQNHNANGLPDGLYYFQITDPSGDVLLSTDPIECRVLQVVGGRVSGVPAVDPNAPPCYHNVGTYDSASGSTPVQMIPFNDTPNPGGEYKAWITPVGDYDASANLAECRHGQPCHGFLDDKSKTDNFKIRKPGDGEVVVCKFNDVDGNGVQDAGEPNIAHWLITASYGNTSKTEATLEDGCISFNAPDGAVVTLTEETRDGWVQTAPQDGNGAVQASIVVTAIGDDTVTAPSFGNHEEQEQLQALRVTKTAEASFDRKFAWDIEKSVDQTRIDLPAGQDAIFNYTVSVTHDAGTDANFKVKGVITVVNPNLDPVTGVNVGDEIDNGGVCTVVGGTNATIPGGPAPDGGHADFEYTCSFASNPGAGFNTASITYGDHQFVESAPAAYDFAGAEILFDDQIAVTDPMGGGSLGVVSASDDSPTAFTYSNTVAAPAGTCVTVDNTATFTTNTTAATGSASQSVKVCGGLPLTMSKTAVASNSSNITKAVDKTLVEQKNGSATFNYTVVVTTSGWAVNGVITVNNPNNWQDITANVSDVLSDNGTCSGGSVNVPAGGSAQLAYSCSYASAPTGQAGTNTATAEWDATAAHTETGSATATAGYDFGSFNMVDTFNGTPTTYGPISGNTASTTFNYPHTVPNAVGGQCATYNNTAVIPGGSASQSVNICNQATGDSTIGFWQNKNGQAIIKGANQADLAAFLTQFTPFQDITGSTVIATYTTNLVKAANSSGATMNAMLKAQMLGTALNVYFTDPAHNALGAPTPLGIVNINTTMVCTDLTCTAYEDSSSVFGGSPKTVMAMLVYASTQSNSGGSLWYGQDKFTQELAKDAFDAINNQAAWIAP